MIFKPPRLLLSVKAKLFAGFLAMSVLIMGVGGYSLHSIGGAGNVVTDTFDRPLMAVNFARSASRTFAALELEVLRLSNPVDPVATFDRLAESFTEELQIARERSIAPRAESFFDDVERDFKIWFDQNRPQLDTRLRAADDSELSIRIEENLDIIVELQTNQSFRNRQSAIATMSRIRRLNLYAISAALLLTLGLTAWIAVTIVRPLKAAAVAARKISHGRFDVLIPEGGEDETGQLLRTMRSMQSNIRTRMEAEQDLRSLAQQRLAESLENSKDAVLLTDVNGRIIVANPGVGQLFTDLAHHSDGSTVLNQPYERHFSASGIPHSVDRTPQFGTNEFQLSDGRWLRVNASSTGEGGQLFIWSDITEAKAQAERLRTARDAAEAASRAKTLFLAAMSHELNTPLNAIIGLADVLKMQHARPGGNADQANMANMISQSGGVMAQIVRDVLEIADDDNEIMDMNARTTIDLGEAIDRAVGPLHERAVGADIHLHWTRPSLPVPICGDLADLQLLTAKLLNNAIKFNRPGGSVKVQLRAVDGHTARLDIIDNGIGIDAADYRRILQPFTQVDEGYTRSSDGTGLGLCVADRIARRHGTHIGIRSAPDVGSVFSVEFALAQSDDPSSQTERRAA